MFIEAILILGFLSPGFFLLFLYFVHKTSGPPNLSRLKGETHFLDENLTEQEFGATNADGEASLSIIVPSYNEQKRLPKMMEETLNYLERRQKDDKSFSYEIVIVDDGSSDGTSKVALEYTKKYGGQKVRVLRLRKNRGKGGAVRMGVLSCRGKLVLFADADGATKFSDVAKLERSLGAIERDGLAVVCGSRAHLEKESIAQRSLFRTVLMKGFHGCVVALGGVSRVKDTQCGFKLFTRAAAIKLFENLHLDRWAFDVELLFLAHQFDIPTSEISVSWQEVAGSKLSPLESSIQMGYDLLMIRLRYMTGAWKVLHKQI